MTLKLLVNELVEIPEGPLTRTEAEAPPPPTLTSVADNTRESPPRMPGLLKRTLSPLVLDRPFERAPLLPAFYPCMTGCIAVLFQVEDTIPRSRGRCWAIAVNGRSGSASGQGQGEEVAPAQAAAPDNPASSPSVERTIVRSAG